MHRLCILTFATLFLLLTSCQSPVNQDQQNVQADLSPALQLCRNNPRYLEYKGEPLILITSAEHYGAVLNLDFDYRLYLETLGNEGFNYTRIFTGTYIEPVDNIFGIQKNTLAPMPGSYLAPWIKQNDSYDLERFNPDYFIRLKDFIQEAEKQGIVVEVTLFTSIYAENSWKLCPFNSINNINMVGDIPFQRVNTLFNGGLQTYQEKFIRKIVSELNDFDNVFFEIQNEPWSDNGCLGTYVNEEDDSVFSRPWQKKVEVANRVAMDWQGWVAGVIREEEEKLPKKHLIAQNICNFQFDLDTLPQGIAIVNFHYALPGAVQMNLDLGGVIGLDETGFMPHEDALYIDQAWRVILSGGGLYNNLDYSFTSSTEAGDWNIPESNPGWGGKAFREKLSILVETINMVPFYEMEFSGTILDAGKGNLKQYGLKKEGEIYLIFVENLKDAELIPQVPPSSYEVSFIKVDTGDKNTETVLLGNEQAITSPFAGDRVAVLIRKSE
ncbi:MAG: hypothetical protein E4H10_17260 [Bacteroidia bacterium]|nr:MAG: hypothetical protein E4H10_17260 [Bacteroidia bacterium]